MSFTRYVTQQIYAYLDEKGAKTPLLESRLRFSSHRGKFEENKMAVDKVLPRAYAPILSSGTVAITCFT